jgi:hypothetical protein
MAHSSSGLGHRPLKAEITGSNPVCAIRTHNHVSSQATSGLRRFRFWVLPAKCSNRVATGSLYLCFKPCLLEECSIELSHGILLHAWQDMRVHIHRDTDLSVAEQFLYNFWMDAEAQQERRRKVICLYVCDFMFILLLCNFNSGNEPLY